MLNIHRITEYTSRVPVPSLINTALNYRVSFYLYYPLLFTSPSVAVTPQFPVGEQQTVDQNTTQVGLPECVVRTMSGPLTETTQRTHAQSPGYIFKISDPAGNRTPAAGLGAGNLLTSSRGRADYGI